MASPKPKIAASGAATHESLKDELKISNAELFGSLESHFPKKEKKSEKRKTARNKSAFSKTTKRFHTFLKKTKKKSQIEVALHSHLGHLSCRFSTRHLDICAPPAAPYSRSPRFHSVVGRYPFAAGSCYPGFIYLLIHRIPQTSFHPQNKFPPPIHRDLFIPCPPDAAPVDCGLHLGPCCPRVAHNRSLLPVVVVRARNLPRLMSHVKTNYRPPCLLKEKNKSYLLPT
jgi:hypothetical protein